MLVFFFPPHYFPAIEFCSAPTKLLSANIAVVLQLAASRGWDLESEVAPRSAAAPAGLQFSAASQRLPAQSSSPAGSELVPSLFPN